MRESYNQHDVVCVDKETESYESSNVKEGICAEMKMYRRKYQHLKCTFWILVVAIIVLIMSLIVHCPPLESILQNIFSGLVTGLAVTLISSLKSKELKDAEIEDQFFKMVHEIYISSRRVL